MLSVALFLSRAPQWEEGIWVVISVCAILGPYAPSMTLQKSIERIMGTTAGLLLSVLCILIFSYVPIAIPFLGVALAYTIAFTALQNYKYFIMVVTMAIALNFADMYVPYTPFEPMSFITSRGMAVLIGVTAYLIMEHIFFGRKNIHKFLDAATSDYLKKIIEQIDSGASWNSLEALYRARQEYDETVGQINRKNGDEHLRAQRCKALGRRVEETYLRGLATNTTKDFLMCRKTRLLLITQKLEVI
jgi:uncharacterized membrane protein YccC